MRLAEEYDILNLEDLQAQVADMQNKKLLEKHEYKISQGKDGYWRTYLPDDFKPKRRRQLKYKNKEDLEKVLIKFYKQKADNPTFKEIFNQWIQEKSDYKEICAGTITKYKNDYIRFCSEKPIEKIRIGNLTEEDLYIFIKTSIVDMELTAKAYSGLRLILRGMLKYAKRKHYTEISAYEFFGDLDIGKNVFKKKIKDKSLQVFTDNEAKMIVAYIAENPTIRNLGILLVLQSGVRVGELASLKRGDINFQTKTLHIQRTEITYKDQKTNKSVNEVREYPKNENADRYIILPDTAITTLRKVLQLNAFGEYLFEEDKKRIRENAFNRRLTRICDNLKIPRRSMHKLRKTYGTTLINAGLKDDFVTLQMGHSDISTTREYYYYCNKEYDEKRRLIVGAIPY